MGSVADDTMTRCSVCHSDYYFSCASVSVSIFSIILWFPTWQGFEFLERAKKHTYCSIRDQNQIFGTKLICTQRTTSTMHSVIINLWIEFETVGSWRVVSLCASCFLLLSFATIIHCVIIMNGLGRLVPSVPFTQTHQHLNGNPRVGSW